MTDQTTEAQSRFDVVRTVNDCNRFACELYSKIAEGTAENFCFSPSSISQVLAMTFAGANGTTAQEMQRALQLTLGPEKIHESFRRLRTELQPGGVEIRVANRLWGQQGYHFLPEFRKLTEQYYGAPLAEVDFRKSTEVASDQINTWIAEKTAGKIENLIPSGMLTDLTRLVLTNAIYFLGYWEKSFKEENTEPKPFWLNANCQASVEQMQQSGEFDYAKFEGIQVLGLPYQEGRSSSDLDNSRNENLKIGVDSKFMMNIILPDAMNGLEELEGQVNIDNINRWTNISSQKVDVTLPRFRIESNFDLDTKLKMMGMILAFSFTEADFSKMTDDPEGLFIAKCLHKSFVEVNEKGTEAAAASAVIMETRGSGPEIPKEFRADHPFLFLIRDRETRLIHFMGRLANPSQPAVS